MKNIVLRILSDPRYQQNIDYGKPRPGHPEGIVRLHIAELESNLEKLASRISDEQYWKLKFLIHTHDTFKAQAVPNSSIESPTSHASLARKFASEFTDDPDLLNMIQFHDVNFSLWKQFAAAGSYDLERFSMLLKAIIDWDLFLMFIIVDGCAKGKDPAKTEWFITEVNKYKDTTVDVSWLLPMRINMVTTTTPVNIQTNHADRVPILPLDLGPVEDVRVNRSAVERRAATIPTRRTVKREWQAAWLLQAVRTIDLTTLSGDDTPGTVKRLCAKARQPIRSELLEALKVDKRITTGAVCVYHGMVATAVEALRGSGIPVAAVSTGFPAGLNPFKQKIQEIEASVKAGASEIDIVISRQHVLTQNWKALYHEVKAFREACGPAHMKSILATGELGTLKNVMRASYVCMQAGADFIKTSTGKEPTNATLPVSLVMVRAIRDYHEQTGYKVGFKPAGGVRTAKQSLDWLILMKEELGDEWMQPNLFRIGASALLNDIERQLEHFAYGRYASMQYQALG